MRKTYNEFYDTFYGWLSNIDTPEELALEYGAIRIELEHALREIAHSIECQIYEDATRKKGE